MAYCISNSKDLESLSLEEYKGFSELFEEDVFEAISLDTCVKNRTSYGGPSPENVRRQAAAVKAILKA